MKTSITLLLFVMLSSCGKIGTKAGNILAPRFSPPTHIVISGVSLSSASVRQGKWAVVELSGLPPLSSVTSSSSDGLSFAGTRTRFNVRTLNTQGILSADVLAAFNGSSDSANYQITILPGYPEVEIVNYVNTSLNIFDISGEVKYHSTLADPTQFKIIACLHADIYYCQDLASVNADGSFSKTDHNFFGGYPYGDRVQFVLTHNSVSASDGSGVIDTFLETKTGYSVWKPMDGTNYINFKNYHLLDSVVHADPQIRNLKSRLNKTEETAGLGVPALPARFIRSFLDSDQFYIYDQALAIFAFARAGEADAAKTVLNAIKNRWQYQGSSGWFYFSYNNDNSGSIYPIEGDRRVAGATAWLSMAINYYKKVYPADNDYDLMAKSVVEYLSSQTQAITVNGTSAKALRFGPTNIVATNWNETDTAALEHNLDFYSALQTYMIAYPADPNVAVYMSLRDDIRNFIDSLWISSENRFYPGANFSTGLTNTVEIYLDTQSWGILAAGTYYKSGLVKNCELFLETAGYLNGGNGGLAGFYDTKLASGAESHKFLWSEGTAGQILALQKVFNETGENYTCNGLTKVDFISSVQNLADSEGGVPYASETSNTDFTTSSSVAGTAWLYFVTAEFNPFDPQ